MSSCEVEVRLDGASRSFAAGDSVAGSVVVTAGGDLAPRGVRIRQLWRVHGRGNTFEEVVEERSVEVQRLAAGVRHEYPFRFTAPERPLTYHGHLIHVDHYVRGEVDISRASDPRGEADYLLRPGPASAAAYMGEPKSKARARPASGWQKALGWILLPVLLPLVLALFAIVLPIALVVLAVKLVQRWLAERRLGAVVAEIGTPTPARTDPEAYAGPGAGLVGWLKSVKRQAQFVHPGQALPVRLRFRPRHDVDLDGADLEISAVESATSGSGTDATTHRHTVWEKKLALVESRTLAAGQPVEVSVRVELPEVAAWSLVASDSKVTWKARFSIRIPGWPDWVREHELRMVPER